MSIIVKNLFLVLGAPIWLSLTVATVAIFFSLYLVLWSVAISLWAVFVSLAVCAPCGIAAGVIFATGGNVPVGILTVGAGVFCIGLSVFVFFACKALTKGAVSFIQRFFSVFKKEDA